MYAIINGALVWAVSPSASGAGRVCAGLNAKWAGGYTFRVVQVRDKIGGEPWAKGDLVTSVDVVKDGK